MTIATAQPICNDLFPTSLTIPSWLTAATTSKGATSTSTTGAAAAAAAASTSKNFTGTGLRKRSVPGGVTPEMAAAAHFVAGLLAAQLTAEQRSMLAGCIGRQLWRRCAGVWHPEAPMRGQATRAIRWTRARPDPCVLVGLEAANLRHAAQWLPQEFTVWVDPGETCISVGDRGVPITIFRGVANNRLPPARRERARSLSPARPQDASLSPNARAFVPTRPASPPASPPTAAAKEEVVQRAPVVVVARPAPATVAVVHVAHAQSPGPVRRRVVVLNTHNFLNSRHPKSAQAADTAGKRQPLQPEPPTKKKHRGRRNSPKSCRAGVNGTKPSRRSNAQTIPAVCA